jgi:deoxyribonuclease-4
MVAIGAHTHSADPLAEAAESGAQAVQFFLGDPQSWRKPPPHPFAAALTTTPLVKYVHAAYLINVATTNNRIRIPSRKMLAEHAAGAAALGAKGLIVHAGHVGGADDAAKGFENWRKVFEREQFPVRILIENTAGGDNAMARRFDRLARLWDAVGEYDVGFCLDTCHAFSAGEKLEGIVERVLAITGRIDLVHANSSRDAFDSGADRHANYDVGSIDPELIAAVCAGANCDVIVETPGGAAGTGADMAYLRQQLQPAG